MPKDAQSQDPAQAVAQPEAGVADFMALAAKSEDLGIDKAISDGLEQFTADTVEAYEALSHRVKALEDGTKVQVAIETLTYALERIVVAIEDLNLIQQRIRR